MERDVLNASLVRIRTIEDEVVGAGFLIGERQVLTCAHVIVQALDLSNDLVDPPLASVVLDFPLLAPRLRLAARVVFWQPVEHNGGGDIAGLELLGDAPTGARTVQFSSANDVWEHTFCTFGFPAGQDDGVWATGRLLGRQANHWVQLEDVKTEGYAVIPGFSGGPVWDTQLQGIVGMVVAASRNSEAKTAFVIPFEVLKNAWDCLQPTEHPRIFLSAAPGDRAFARQLEADLRAQEIDVWDELDETTNVDSEVQKQGQQHPIRNVQAVLLVASSQAFYSPVVKKHLYLAQMFQRRLILAWRGNDEHTQPQYAECRDTALVDLRNLSYETALQRVEAALSQSRSLTTLFEPSQKERRQTPRNPYKGLHPFTTQDTSDFFGRERLVNELVNDITCLLMDEASEKESKRCLTVIGASGSGKSSVVMAGLLVQLQQGAVPGSETWTYLAPMVPGRHPIKALSRILQPHFPDRSASDLREDLEDETTQALHQFAASLLKERKGKVVLLIDQFEEVFTQTETEEERQRFIDLLLTATTTSSGSLLVLLTLRADFYDRPMQYPPLSRLIQAHQRQVLPMELEDLRATIVQPANLPDVQLSFEGNLVGDLLFEIQGQVGALPLLQFTLDQLFERRDGQRLKLQAYREIGGVKGALSQHTEQTYMSLPSDDHRNLARTLFLRLLEPGASQKDTTRRRADLSEFTFTDPEQTRKMRETIDAFITARLLTTSEVGGAIIIEVSHEAVIREWERLATWLHEAREDIQLQQSLSADVVRWEQRKHPQDRLYRGTQLKDAQAWARRNKPSEREAAFLRASTARQVGFRAVIAMIGLLVVLLVPLAGLNLAGLNLRQFLFPTTVTTSDDSGMGSLREVLAAAKPGSTITFDSSVRGVIRLSSELNVTKNVNINGPGASLLSIRGSGTFNVVNIQHGAFVTISDLAFNGTNQTQETSSGIIFNRGTLTLTRILVSHNITGGGAGGISNLDGGSLSLIDSDISSNTTIGAYGGGIGNYGGSVKINNSIISNNTAYAGAGIFNNGGPFVLNNSAISGNSTYNSSGGSRGDGGGIYNVNGGALTLNNSTIALNKASGGWGGGIDNGYSHPGQSAVMFTQGGSITLLNSTISDNTANHGGGILANGASHVIIVFSTIYNNAAHQGGGIAIVNQASGKPNQMEMRNSIIAGNHAPTGTNIAGMITSDGYNLIQDTAETAFAANQLHLTDKMVGPQTDLGIDPTLSGGPTQIHKLLPSSPAIGQIPLTDCHINGISTDELGAKRPNGREDACDIGAYEHKG